MYIKKTYICGRVIEVYKTFSRRYGKHSPRSPNRQPTSDEQRLINERNACANLTRLINANFLPGDYHLVLTYRRDERPSVNEAKRLLRNYRDALRRAYRASGLELKYIVVTEYRKAAIHHHLIVNSCDVSLLQEKWTHGRIHLTPLDSTGEYSQLASYLIKETSGSFGDIPSGKRWSASKNLIHPKPKIEIIKASTWRLEPKAIKGYVLDKSSITEILSASGELTQFYRMIKAEVCRR